MKDTEMRGLLLESFYNQRRAGWLGLGIDTGTPLEFDDRIPAENVIFIADQLGDAGLIEWKPLEGNRGQLIAGVGKISSFGIDVIEGEEESPIAMIVDQSSHVQNVNISGQHGGVQVAGAHSQQSQTASQNIEHLVGAINSANVSPEEKEQAKSKLAEFLKTGAAAEIFGQSLGALFKLVGS
jgi:hypothetical protein